jgi:hypothetical protein
VEKKGNRSRLRREAPEREKEIPKKKALFDQFFFLQLLLFILYFFFLFLCSFFFGFSCSCYFLFFFFGLFGVFHFTTFSVIGMLVGETSEQEGEILVWLVETLPYEKKLIRWPWIFLTIG